MRTSEFQCPGPLGQHIMLAPGCGARGALDSGNIIICECWGYASWRLVMREGRERRGDDDDLLL